MFIIDSQALKRSIDLIKKLNLILLKYFRVASKAIHHIQKETNTQVIAGGLINTIDEVNEAVKNGAKYVTTSYDKLW